MGPDIKGGAALAKAKAMYGMRITKNEFDELITGNSIPGVVAFLKKHPLYMEIMSDANENMIRRGALETLIRKSLSSDYKKLSDFMYDPDKEVLKIYTLRSEIEFILRIIIQLRNNSFLHKAEIMATIPQFYEMSYSEHMQSLLSAASFSELTQLMAKTKYAGVLDGFNLEKTDTAEMETALFTHFYRMLGKFIREHYRGHEADELHRQFGMKVDIENIRRLIRLKKSFSGVSYKKYIIDFGYRLSPSDFEQAAASSDPAGFFGAIMPLYGEYYANASETNSDSSKDRIQLSIDRNILLTSSSEAAAAVAYLGIKSNEIKNLFHIIESIRYGVFSDETREKIIYID